MQVIKRACQVEEMKALVATMERSRQCTETARVEAEQAQQTLVTKVHTLRAICNGRILASLGAFVFL